MLKEAIEKIASMAKNEVHEVRGEYYSNEPVHHIEKVIERPDSYILSTLSSLSDMIMLELDKQRKLPLIVHVKTPDNVMVKSTYQDDYTRDFVYNAIADVPDTIIGKWTNQENAIIALRSTFVTTEDTDYLLQLLSKISDESKVTTTDNGVSQSVEAKTGIALLGKVPVKPKVTLRPYRTFFEVEQPESEYLLRVRDGGQIGVFEADGGAWMLSAKKNIKNYLEKQMGKAIEAGNVMVIA